MNIYVVHYKKLSERKKSTEREFEKYSYNLIFKTDFDKENLSREVLRRFNYRYIDRFIKRKPGYRKLTKSMISAFLKHIDLLINQEEENYIAIIEDDLILCDDFENKFNRMLSELPENFAFCFFDSFMEDYGKVEERLYNKDKIVHKIDYYEPPNFKKSSNKKAGKTRGGGGYLFNLKYRSILKEEYLSQDKIYIMNDHWLNHFINKYNLDVYWVEPPLSKQMSQNKLIDKSY